MVFLFCGGTGAYFQSGAGEKQMSINQLANRGLVAHAVSEFLGGDLQVQGMAAAVDPSLHRERGDRNAH